MLEEDVFALFKRQTKLKNKDDSMTSTAINVFNKMGEPNHIIKKNNLKNLVICSKHCNINNQSCDIKINFIENEHLAYHNVEH